MVFINTLAPKRADKMKKVLWIVTLIISIISSETENEHFTISGEVKNANGEKLYLVELQSNNIVFLDSVILNNEGIFSFKGKTDVPKFYALRTNPKNYLTIIVNPYDHIIIKTQGNNLAKNPVVEGSPESKKIAELRKRLDQSVSKLDSLGAYYKSLIGTKDLARVRD